MIEQIRQYIRDRGFASAMAITLEIIQKATPSAVDSDWYDQIACDDIHRVEYTNSLVAAYRVKDLFYFNPHS